MGLYQVTIAITLGIYLILTMGLNIITGYTGQVSLGHAAFFGAGAYASAILSVRYGLPFWGALPLAVVATALMGAVLGTVSTRLREDSLAITTIGVNFVVVSVFKYSSFFGGALGIGNIRYPSLFGRVLTKPEYLLVVAACVALGMWFDRRLVKSWLGLALRAVGQDEAAAQSLGVDSPRFKIIAFIIGTAYAGAAGSLYAHFMTFISPQDFGFPVSISIISMAVFGGLGTLRGAILGSCALGLAPEVFRPLVDYRNLMYGALLLLMMRFQPQGLIGDGSPLWERLRSLIAGGSTTSRVGEGGARHESRR
ncbi:MAG: branched-chain amino acid ABC transporter permease [Firmicutes bacterium]|jgi:branched-chain amino acid transport system permease protein|nr:branched-chain amino acid ABC transporter permease [Bacillota bacterium]MDH7496534.1 branched-chain amino acid ABC transporter permease [Bacillota bacterium]